MNNKKINLEHVIGWSSLIFSIIVCCIIMLCFIDKLLEGFSSLWIILIAVICDIFYSLMLIRDQKKIDGLSSNKQTTSVNTNAEYGNHSNASVDKYTLYSNGNTVYEKNDDTVQNSENNEVKPVYESSNYQASNNSIRINEELDTGTTVFLIIFFTFWFGFLVFFDFIALIGGDWFMVIFSVPFWAAGFFILSQGILKKDK